MQPSEITSGFVLGLDQGVAQHLGIEAAVVYNHIIYWLRINAQKEDVELIDGKYWMYQTNKQMAEFFGFLSEDQVNRAIKKLSESGLIEKKPLSKNPFDRTLWYTIHDQTIIKKSLRNPQNCGMPFRTGAESDTLKTAECIYTKEQQKEKQSKTAATSTAAAAPNSSFSPENIKYTSPGGKEKFATSSEIYRHFTKFPYKTETIQKAIKTVQEKKEPIGNILKLLEIICKDIENNPKPEVKSNENCSVPKRNDLPGKNPWKEKIKDKKNVS